MPLLSLLVVCCFLKSLFVVNHKHWCYCCHHSFLLLLPSLLLFSSSLSLLFSPWHWHWCCHYYWCYCCHCCHPIIIWSGGSSDFGTLSPVLVFVIFIVVLSISWLQLLLQWQWPLQCGDGYSGHCSGCWCSHWYYHCGHGGSCGGCGGYWCGHCSSHHLKWMNPLY